MGFNVIDNSMVVSIALPADDSTVSTAGIDLLVGSDGDHLADMELKIAAPALAVGELGNGATMTYDVYHDTASNFGSEALLMDNVITQTGADGAGAAAQTVRVRLPVDVNRYVRVKATNSADADASAKTLTVSPVF